MALGSLPFVTINASDLNTGFSSSLIQEQWDFLCSDMDTNPVANAVIAASAVPMVFGPFSW